MAAPDSKPNGAGVVDFRVRLPTELRPQEERPRQYIDRYDQVLDLEDRRDLGLSQLIEDMDGAGVAHAVVHAEHELGDPADELNEAVARLVSEQPDRFSGYGTVTLEPLDSMRAVRQVARVAEFGLAGISIQPSFFRLAIDDRRLYPVYAKARELELGVALHTGINYSSHMPIRNDHPLQLDQVACDIEGIVLIACHAGWPWTGDLVAVARKHPSVYIEFGGLAPKYVAAADGGWPPMLRFMDTLLQGQVLFGTDWPVFPMDRALSEWRAMGLKPEALDGLLGANARRLLASRSSEEIRGAAG